jgi:hypothetical protein
MKTPNEPGYYLLPMDHPIAIENVRRHSSKAACVDNVWTNDELNWLWKNAFTADYNNPRLNRNGTLIVDVDMEIIYNRYKDKFDSILGPVAEKSPAIGGNYFITPQQYGLHQDAMRKQGYNNMLEHVPLNHTQRKYTTWKNIITPLWVGSHLDELDGGQIVFFEQRDIGWAKVYNGGAETKNIASIYEIVTDYSHLQFYNRGGDLMPRSNEPFDKDFYNKYMNTPYKRLQGLTPESVFDWTPGSPCVFDAVQLHATNEGTKTSEHKKTWNSKMGLLMTFMIELDEDLLIEWRKEQAEM